MKLIFMRHAESGYNVENMINCDPKVRVRISEGGKEQANEVAKEFKGKKIDVIFASEFLRAQQTAQIVRGERKIKIRIDKRINEGNLGFEGENVENYREARRKSGGRINLFRFREELESFHDVRKRIERFIYWLRKQNFSNVLIITHEVCVQAARCVLEEIDEETAFSSPVENCEYFEYKI